MRELQRVGPRTSVSGSPTVSTANCGANASSSARGGELLNSKSRLFPGDLGNRYDWVGRNLQGHVYTGAFRPVCFRCLRRCGTRHLDRRL